MLYLAGCAVYVRPIYIFEQYADSADPRCTHTRKLRRHTFTDTTRMHCSSDNGIHHGSPWVWLTYAGESKLLPCLCWCQLDGSHRRRLWSRMTPIPYSRRAAAASAAAATAIIAAAWRGPRSAAGILARTAGVVCCRTLLGRDGGEFEHLGRTM